MNYKNRHFKEDVHIRPQEIPTYAIEYYDFESEKKIFVNTKEGKRLEFYDSVEAEEFAYFYSRTEGVYAFVVRV